MNGFAKEKDGAIYVDLEQEGYGKKYLLRGDGTTLYMTQDLYLSSLKKKEFSADRNIFIVAKEQEYHFKVLFELLDRLNEKQNNFHLSYGYVYDKNGKKFSSRLGNTIGADEVYNLIVEKAKNNLLSRSTTTTSKDEIKTKSQIIGFSALAFAFLKHNPLHDINFDPDKALEFEGETGPYLQYTYARIKSLLRKGEFEPLESKISKTKFDEKQIQLIKELKEYSNILTDVSLKLKISSLAHYLLKIAKMYNEIYQNKKILTLTDPIIKNSLLLLSFIVSEVIKDGLELLSIDVVEEM